MRFVERTPFGERLFKARTSAGLSQETLAERAGTSQSNIAELEKTGHGSAKASQLAAACNVSSHWLSTGEGIRAASPSFEASAPSVHWRQVADAVAQHLMGLAVNPVDFLAAVDAIVADVIPEPAPQDEIDIRVQRYLMQLSLKSMAST